MFSLIVSFLKALTSNIGIIFKILKIVLILAFLWFVFSYLNGKIGLLTPFKSILKSVFAGIKGAFSLIGFG